MKKKKKMQCSRGEKEWEEGKECGQILQEASHTIKGSLRAQLID